MYNETKPFQILIDDNCYLSPILPSDKSAFVEYLNDKEIYAYTLRIPYPYTENDAETFFKTVADSTEKYGHPIQFVIRDNEGKAIGGIGFDGLIPEHQAELGYWLAKPFWGQGIMTNVVAPLCDFAFTKWNLVRIFAHVFVSNVGSSRVLEKNGFELEGVLRKHHKKDGKFIDAKLFGLVR